MMLRLAVVVALAIIALNPHDRTVKSVYRPSQVILVFDTSLSMGFQEKNPSQSKADPNNSHLTRQQAIIQAVSKLDLVAKLSKQHEVIIFTFDSKTEGPWHIIPSEFKPITAQEQTDEKETGPARVIAKTVKPEDVKWEDFLKPVGTETRLGESLLQLMRERKSGTLAGIVLFTDGGLNTVDPDDPETAARKSIKSANDFAKRQKIPLLVVGVGSTEKPINLRISRIEAPSDVNKGDAYHMTVFVQGSNLTGKTAQIVVSSRPEGTGDNAWQQVEDGVKTVQLGEDGIPVSEKFDFESKEEGSFEYRVQAKVTPEVLEFDQEDNTSLRKINVREQNMGVLIIASGPTRDYRFSKNMLFRHENINVDVWLQSVDANSAHLVVQDCDELMTEFPANFPNRPMADRGELSAGSHDATQYDVVLAFDADWLHNSFSETDGLNKLNHWVATQAGGMILVACEINTGELGGDTPNPALDPIRSLYPVILKRKLPGEFNSSRTPTKFETTDDGKLVGFLKLDEESESSNSFWEEFEGFYQSYPTDSAKAGATVYSYFNNPEYLGSEYGLPILMASQFYGSGKTLYLGSNESWRLRAIGEEYFDRFWTKVIREVGQGRMSRQSAFGTVMLERDTYFLGQTVRVLSHLVDARNDGLTDTEAKMEIIEPDKSILQPERKLLLDKTRPGYYSGSFRASRSGTYKIKVFNPSIAQEKPIVASIVVEVPNMEKNNPQQNVNVLRELSRDTGGNYFQLGKLDEQVVAKLRNRGEEVKVDERLRELWDVDLVMFLLVGLLSIEWLTRKLLKLA